MDLRIPREPEVLAYYYKQNISFWKPSYRGLQESCWSVKTFFNCQIKNKQKYLRRLLGNTINDGATCFLNFVWGERAAVHRLLYNTTTLERIHHSWPRPTTVYWKPNYRDSIGVYCRTVYIPLKELCLCCLLTVSGMTNGLLQQGYTRLPKAARRKSYKNYLHSTLIAPKLRLSLDRRFFLS